MHSIDRKWTDLAAGYQTIQLQQARLETEFGRAVQVGYKHKFRRELTEWQKKRRVFFVLATIAPLSIFTLCLTAIYFREVACVIAYWTILVVIILATLAVAGRNYIREVMNRPGPEHVGTLALDLERRWWDSLSPEERMSVGTDEKENADFLIMLSQALPDTCLAIQSPGLLLFSPAGLWLFQIEHWSGTITRQEGIWKQLRTVRDKLGRKQINEKIFEMAPDDQWLHRKNELVKILNERLPKTAWIGDLIQGGVVFTHPKTILDKTHIQGNTAAYGLATAWVERVRRAPAAEGFSLEIQLEILDALHDSDEQCDTSAQVQAGSLYQAAVNELRQSIAKMVT